MNPPFSPFRHLRRMLVPVLIAPLALHSLLPITRAATAPAPTPISAERQVAIKNVCAWPMLVTLRDGTIVAIYHMGVAIWEAPTK